MQVGDGGVDTKKTYPTPHQTRGGIPLKQDCNGKTTPSATRGKRGCIAYTCSTTTYPNAKASGHECPIRLVFRSDKPPRLSQGQENDGNGQGGASVSGGKARPGTGQGGDGGLLWYLDHSASHYNHAEMCAFLYATHKAESGRERKRPVGGRHNKTAIVRVCAPALFVLLLCLLDPKIYYDASLNTRRTYIHTYTHIDLGGPRAPTAVGGERRPPRHHGSARGGGPHPRRPPGRQHRVPGQEAGRPEHGRAPRATGEGAAHGQEEEAKLGGDC